jgi:hypothetical protein
MVITQLITHLESLAASPFISSATVQALREATSIVRSATVTCGFGQEPDITDVNVLQMLRSIRNGNPIPVID